MTEIDTDKLRVLHTAANRIADNGNHLAIKVSSGCFDYCSGGCDCAEEAKRIKATADSDAVEFHRLISAILAMAEERDRSEKHRNDLADKITEQSIEIGALKAENARMREALERIERAGTFQPHREDPPAFDTYADIARRALGKDKS